MSYLIRSLYMLLIKFRKGAFSAGAACMLATQCYGQDPSFSQYNLNQFYFNPAYTGDHGGYQLAATYRSLWPNAPGKIFPGALSTYYTVFDAYLKKGNYTAGAGIFAMQDIEGEGYLTTSTVGISYAQHFNKIKNKTDELPRIQVSLGFKAYFNSISVNWDKLVFSDQVNINQGITGQSASDHDGIGRKYTVDMDVGLLLKNNFAGKDNWYNEVGFAMAHLLSPSMSLTGTATADSRMPRKYIATYRSSVSLPGKYFYLGPTILFENQKQFYELNTGMDLFINPKPGNSVIPFCISLMNRLSVVQNTSNTNAIIASVRYKGVGGKQTKVVYNIGFAADFPYTGLAVQTKGAYELSLGLVFQPKGNNNFSKCPYQTF
ncbi:MAG: putative rane protein [Bacteroidota bacterium]|nr:putative rane protein [Bacteroidota bacterium]